MDCSCAPMFRFFSVASDGATTERQIYNRVFGNFVPVWGTIVSSIMNRFGRCFRNLLEGKMYLATWCLFLPAGCREAANFRYCFYSQAKNQVFRPAGATRCTYSGQTLQYDGHLGPLGGAKFHINRRRGWECGPQNIKNFHFLVKSRHIGATPLTDFQNF